MATYQRGKYWWYRFRFAGERIAEPTKSTSRTVAKDAERQHRKTLEAGAVSDMGRACAFVAEDGSPLPWLRAIDSIAVTGRHAIFLAERMVRLEMLRSGRSWELAITLHALSAVPNRVRSESLRRCLVSRTLSRSAAWPARRFRGEPPSNPPRNG
jgi:hypothetical protein